MSLFDGDLRTDVLGNIIWDVTKWIAAGLVGIAIWILSKLGTNALTHFVQSIQPYTWPITILFFIIGALIAIFLYRRFSKFRPQYPRLDCDFEILELEIIYNHLSKTRMTYTKRKKLKALRNGLDRYIDRYRWTGMGNVQIKSNIRGQRIIEEERKSVWQFYAIRFNRNPNRGEEVQTEVVWELEDLQNAAVPFLSATMEEPTRRLILKVQLPANDNVEEVVMEVLPFMGAKTPFSSDTKNIEHNEYTWTVENPKLLYHYEMRWEWPS